MLTNDATILKIKHEVLYQVAKLAYAGEFDEKKDELAYKLIPGPKPQFRCCVYKGKRNRPPESKTGGGFMSDRE